MAAMKLLVHRRSSRDRRRASRIVALSTFLLVCAALSGRPVGGPRGRGVGRASVAVEPSSAAISVPAAGLESEDTADAVLQEARPMLQSWEQAVHEGQLIPQFGRRADRLVNRSLLTAAENHPGGTDTATGDSPARKLKSHLELLYLQQRSHAEEQAYLNLKKDLVRLLKRRGRELTVREKLPLFQGACARYNSEVDSLRPSFVDDPHRAAAEQRLSELQWGIMETAEGQELSQKWKGAKARGALGRRRELSVNLLPGLRAMLRPSGFGNFQVVAHHGGSAAGGASPQSEVSVGILNDGSIIDVYNRKATPPFVRFQPTMGVDVRWV